MFWEDSGAVIQMGTEEGCSAWEKDGAGHACPQQVGDSGQDAKPISSCDAIT